MNNDAGEVAAVNRAPEVAGAQERWRAAVHSRVEQRTRLAKLRSQAPTISSKHETYQHNLSAILATAPPWWFPAGESLAFVDRDPLFRAVHCLTGLSTRIVDIGASTGRLT